MEESCLRGQGRKPKSKMAMLEDAIELSMFLWPWDFYFPLGGWRSLSENGKPRTWETWTWGG